MLTDMGVVELVTRDRDVLVWSFPVQGQLSVLTLIPVPVPPPCYCSSLAVKDPGHSAKAQVAGYTCTLRMWLRMK